MLKMTTLEKIYKVLYEKNLNAENLSDEALRKILAEFEVDVFTTDPVQSLSKDVHNYSEDLFIKEKADVAVVRRPRYRPHYKMHRHDFIELTYVYGGICEFVMPGKEMVTLHKGDLILLSTHTDHQFHVDDDDSIVYHIAVRRSTFDKAFMSLLKGEDILSQFFSRIIYGTAPGAYILFQVAGDQKIEALFLEMMAEMHNTHSTAKRMLNIYFEWLCVYLIRNYAYKIWVEDTNNQHVDMVKILQYMRDHYREISLEETAQKFNYSQSYLSKIIKKYTGKTYGKLVREIRMQKACELLKNGSLSGSDIACAVGYQDASSFYRSFKNTYQMTPAQYQALHKEDSHT